MTLRSVFELLAILIIVGQLFWISWLLIKIRKAKLREIAWETEARARKREVDFLKGVTRSREKTTDKRASDIRDNIIKLGGKRTNDSE